MKSVMIADQSIRLIHATTDLARAQAIALRLQDDGHDHRSKIILENALLADYGRNFFDRKEESPAINLNQLTTRFDPEDHTLHEELLKLARIKARQLQNGIALDHPVADKLLGGLCLEKVVDHIHKVRRAITIQLYPHLADDPKALNLMVGPLQIEDQS